MPEWITTKEVVDISGFNADHVRRPTRQGRIEGCFRGVMWWFDGEGLRAYLEIIAQLGTKRFHPGGLEEALADSVTER